MMPIVPRNCVLRESAGLDDTAAVQGLTPGMLVLEGGRERRELLEMNVFFS